MQCFPFAKKIDKKEWRDLCNSFLWKGVVADAKGAKESWECVCKPRDEGGLGIKKLADWNIASWARMIWLLFRGFDSLWIA